MTSLPPLEIQLVLELKRWILAAEIIEILPGSRGSRFTAPVNQDLTDTARQASLLDPCRLWNHHAMVDVW